MSNVIARETYDQSIAVSPKNGVHLPKGQPSLTSLGVVATYTNRALRSSCGVRASSGSLLFDGTLSQEDMAQQVAFGHRKRSLEKGDGIEELLVQACGEEVEDGFNGRIGKRRGFGFDSRQVRGGRTKVSDDGTAVRAGGDPQARRREKLARAAFLTAKLGNESRENLMHELENDIKIMRDFLHRLQNLAHFLEKIEEFMKGGGGSVQDLIALLRKHYAGDPDMLKKVDELEKDLKASVEAREDLDEENWFIRVWEECLHFGRAQVDHNIIERFSHFLSSLLKEIESRTLKNQPQLNQAMQGGRQTFLRWIRTLLEQASKLKEILDIVQGEADGEEAMFKAEMLLVEVMSLATNNNIAREQQQVEMTKLNIRIQELTAKKLQDKLEEIRKAEKDSHGIIGFFKHFFSFVGDTVVDMLTLDGQGLKHDFTESDFVTDLKDVAEFFYNAVITMQTALLSAVTFGQVKALNNAFLEHGEKVISSPALHLISDVVMLVVIAASCVSGQLWLAGVMTVLLLANDVTDSSGHTLMTDMMNGIAEGVQGLVGVFGGQLSDDTAHAVADGILIAVVSAITFGAGAPGAAAEESVSVGENVISSAIEEGASSAGENAVSSAVEEGAASAGENAVSTTAEDGLAQTEREGVLDKIKRASQKGKESIQKFGEKIGFRNGLTITVAGMLMSATNFPADLAKVIAKDDEHLRQILSELFSSLAMVMTIVGGITVSATAGSAQTKLGAILRRIAPRKVMDWCDAHGACVTSKMLQTITASMMVGASMDVVKGIHQILVGGLQGDAKCLQGLLELSASSSNIAEQIGNSNSSELKHIAAEEMRFVKNMGAPALISLGIARALQENAA